VAAKLRCQVEEMRTQLEATKKASDQKTRESFSNAKKLQEDVRRMKEALSVTNSEIITQATEIMEERKRVEEHLLQTQQKSRSLEIKLPSEMTFPATYSY
jgi:phosphosulfolactate synthase (CoM biosynthesis protein A)